MIETAVSNANPDSVASVMRDELAQGDVAFESVTPILRHLVASDGNSLFGDDVVARVRGMLADVAVQLLAATGAEAPEEHEAQDDPRLEAISAALVRDTGFLRHIHALAIEWQFTEKMLSRLGLDPVLSPLLQAQIASADGNTAATAMKLLAAQARYCQAQRRMTLPLGELPTDQLRSAAAALHSALVDVVEDRTRLEAAQTTIVEGHDDATNRLGLAARLISGMGGSAGTALSVNHAGTALFLTALAIGSGQDRDAVVFSTSDAQLARMALSLRAAGLKPDGVKEQFMALHPDVTLPEGFERLDADRAAAILAAGADRVGG